MAETQALATTTTQGVALAQSDYVATLTMERFREAYLPGAKDEADVRLCFEVMRQTGLNPVLKQIYFLERTEKRGETWITKMVPQTSIDGLRLIAERSGKRDGEFPPEWCGEDGRWVSIWLKDKAPAAARVAVHKKGCSQPFYGVALYREYVQTSKKGNVTKFWLEKPALMLAKCAEALAIRKAFPQETAGIYAQEEMQNAPTSGPAPKDTEAGKRFVRLLKKRFKGPHQQQEAADWIALHFQGRKFGQLSEAEMGAAGDLLESEPDGQPEEAQFVDEEPPQDEPRLDWETEKKRFMAVLGEKRVKYDDSVKRWAAQRCGWPVPEGQTLPSIKTTPPHLIQVASDYLQEISADEFAAQLEEARA